MPDDLHNLPPVEAEPVTPAVEVEVGTATPVPGTPAADVPKNVAVVVGVPGERQQVSHKEAIQQPTRKFTFSKTLWVNLIIAVAAFFPEIRDWVQAHPSEVLAALSGLGILLRILTKDKLVLFEDSTAIQRLHQAGPPVQVTTYADPNTAVDASPKCGSVCTRCGKLCA